MNESDDSSSDEGDWRSSSGSDPDDLDGVVVKAPARRAITEFVM